MQVLSLQFPYQQQVIKQRNIGKILSPNNSYQTFSQKPFKEVNPFKYLPGILFSLGAGIFFDYIPDKEVGDAAVEVMDKITSENSPISFGESFLNIASILSYLGAFGKTVQMGLTSFFNQYTEDLFKANKMIPEEAKDEAEELRIEELREKRFRFLLIKGLGKKK